MIKCLYAIYLELVIAVADYLFAFSCNFHIHVCVLSGIHMLYVFLKMYEHDKGNVLLLSVGSIQRNLHRLLCEVHLVLAEEMHLHLIMEN